MLGNDIPQIRCRNDGSLSGVAVQTPPVTPLRVLLTRWRLDMVWYISRCIRLDVLQFFNFLPWINFGHILDLAHCHNSQCASMDIIAFMSEWVCLINRPLVSTRKHCVKKLHFGIWAIRSRFVYRVHVLLILSTMCLPLIGQRGKTWVLSFKVNFKVNKMKTFNDILNKLIYF